jgi:NhaD family Na+/H+ antiporter
MTGLGIIPISMIIVFISGYMAIIFERYIKVNKTASAIIMAVGTWILLFLRKGRITDISINTLNERVGDVSQIIFFLIGAMTLVEIIDSHKGFKHITDRINTRSKKKMLWVISIFAFFLSAILDNLTTTIIMVSLLKKMMNHNRDRMLYGAAVVIAANAGGAWTPIGDVTTTMLWIKGHVTTLAVMKSLFLPSVFSLVVTVLLLSFQFRGNFSAITKPESKEEAEPGSKLIFWIGVIGLVSVPIFKAITGLPPFMGMLIALGVLWLVTDLIHHPYEERRHLTVPQALTRIDITGVLFFLGILLCINALEMIGLLKQLAMFIDSFTSNWAIIATLIGILSSVVDNVPLVAATMGMYDLQVYPVDSAIWQMIAYCAGTGGSILIIGSAAGVALMGLEKVDFIWYLKKVSLAALAGYLSGMTIYLVLQLF